MSYPRMKEKYVYFLRRKDCVGPVKIGCSRLPLVRLREFFRWSPYELECMACGLGGHDLERQLHRMFAAYHLHMEWFAPSDRLMILIARIKTGVPVPVAIEMAGQAEPVAQAESVAA